MDTSTPARAVPKETIMYGFDLSPVHSYEYKPPKGSRSHVSVWHYTWFCSSSECNFL